MGGRGSSSGISDKGRKYGTEYRSLYTAGNIKFVVYKYGSTTAPMETMTKGRVYVTLDHDGKPKFISYYDTENKRKKQIDLDRPHMGVLPHTHHGYNHCENDTAKKFANLIDKERAMVANVNKIWSESVYEKWKIYNDKRKK